VGGGYDQGKFTKENMKKKKLARTDEENMEIERIKCMHNRENRLAWMVVEQNIEP
jgi:hypothetical protein